MQRGTLAAGVAATGVALAGTAVAYGAVLAATGAYLLIVAPLLGLPVALAVHRALRRVCTTGSRAAAGAAAAGVVGLAVIAVGGISFGGIALLPAALALAVAAWLTPRPRDSGAARA